MEKGSVLTANSSPFVFGNTSSPSIASYTPETQQQHPSLTGTRTALPEKARPQRPASPLFSISTEFDSEQVQGTFGELTSKILLAAGVPSTRTLSPSPLLWGEGGWDAGHFAFGEGGDLSKLAFSDGGGGSEGGSGRIDSSANSLPESADSGYGSTVGGGDSLVVDNGLKAAGTTPRLSALVPTATPFVFHPKAPTAGGRLPPSSSLHLNFNHSPAPVPTHLPLPIPPPFTPGGSTWYATPPSPLAQPYTSPSAPQVELPPAQASTSGGWTFDGQGHLVAGQGEAKYTIADEILQLQSTPFAQGGRDVAFASNEIDESRMRQVQHQRSFDGWQSQSQQPYPPTPPSSTPSDLRSRSSSLASVGSYFSPQPPAERSPATAQLQSYFGPAPNASIDVSDAFLHHPLSALQTDPEDLLYTLARQTFVSQSLPISSAAPATPAQCLAMNTHFDRAMHSPNPLATLYGLSPEQANRLAEEPGTSGVSECVLRLAKSRAAMFAGGGREGGPSPNNRKLGLYKTELCRSWEEKGSCRYGTRCQFAHGAQEVRSVARHPKFKSEVCRTFWLHGSCPYGRRCCFIHTTVAGGLPTGPPPDSLTHALSSMSMEPVPDTPPRQISRLARLARLSSLSSMTPIQPGSFGPALANYLGPGSTASSSTMTAYSTASAYLNERFKGDVNDVLFSQDLGAGIKSAGRFTHNPSEVPATYQDPPQSRLRRLAAQGPSQSTYAVERFDSSYPSEPACIATSSPIGRHHSNQSNGSNVSSSTASSYPGFSPFIPRVSSTSSVSSYGGASAYDGACPLQPAGNDWLGGSSSTSARNGALDWSSAEDDEGSTAGRLLERDFGGLSLAIDRSSEMTPRGQRVV